MTSPEAYRLVILEGKNKNEVKEIIDELKEALRVLKSPNYKDEIVCPNKQVRIRMNREYLDTAMECYKEMWGDEIDEKSVTSEDTESK